MIRAKDGGFYVTRKRQERRRALPYWFWVALVGLLWIAGLTRAWSQNSGLSSSSSGNDLLTWEKLSEEFRTALSGQSARLGQALTELETSKANSRTLTGLLEQSLQANERLRSYNGQIAARMQERDEELASAYNNIDRLERHRRNMIIAIGVMTGLILFLLVALYQAVF
jgi:hypothetical protein